VVIKKSTAENRQSSSGVPSAQFVSSWALQRRLGSWRYEFMCGVLARGRDHGSCCQETASGDYNRLRTVAHACQ
jgi:hypothetical protein